MNQQFSTRKKLVILIFAAISSLVIWGAAKYSSDGYFNLESPLVLIYSKDTAYDETKRKQIRRWLQLDSKDTFFEELEQGDTQIYSSLPHFLMHLDDISKGDSKDRYLFKLSKPSTISKKVLRRNVEESFSAEKRLRALRSIVVVLDLDALYVNDMGEFDYMQFEYDLIYIYYNFGAAGLLVRDTNETLLSAVGGKIQNMIYAKDF